MVWKWENSDPFGANAPNEDPSNTGTTFKYNLRFPGQYYDQETGTHQNYFRDYDPATGRYVQSDPIGIDGGLNTFVYVSAKPLANIDRFGLKPGDAFPTEAKAAQDGIWWAWPYTVADGVEYGGWIYQGPDCQYRYTFVKGWSDGIALGNMPEGTTADYHTHPPQTNRFRQPDNFSRVDIKGNRDDRNSLRGQAFAVTAIELAG